MARAAATPQTRSVRLLKVGEQVRHVLSQLLARGQVRDDALSAASVSVTEVRMSPDLRLATVFVKPLLGAQEAEIVKALRTHTAFFQKEVASHLKLKFAAKIRFVSDESFDVAARIERLLADPRVSRDLTSDGEGDDAPIESIPLPFRGGAGDGVSPQASRQEEGRHPNPSPEEEGL